MVSMMIMANRRSGDNSSIINTSDTAATTTSINMHTRNSEVIIDITNSEQLSTAKIVTTTTTTKRPNITVLISDRSTLNNTNNNNNNNNNNNKHTNTKKTNADNNKSSTCHAFFHIQDGERLSSFIINNPDINKMFSEFCKKEYSEENYQFIKHFHDMVNAPSTKEKSDILKYIYDTFIEVDAKSLLNLSGVILEGCRKEIPRLMYIADSDFIPKNSILISNKNNNNNNNNKNSSNNNNDSIIINDDIIIDNRDIHHEFENSKYLKSLLNAVEVNILDSWMRFICTKEYLKYREENIKSKTCSYWISLPKQIPPLKKIWFKTDKSISFSDKTDTDNDANNLSHVQLSSSTSPSKTPTSTSSSTLTPKTSTESSSVSPSIETSSSPYPNNNNNNNDNYNYNSIKNDNSDNNPINEFYLQYYGQSPRSNPDNSNSNKKEKKDCVIN